MSNDSISKTLLVALLLCLVCSIVVSTAAVVLKPAQQANKLLDKQKNILLAAGLSDGSGDIAKQFAQVEKRIVNIETGDFVTDIDLNAYDQRKAQKDPKTSVRIPANIDIASLKRRANYAEIYWVNDADGQLKTLILPISGYGLWSTLHGFIALESDLNTVAGLAFYDHAETPGLGGEVDNPRWKAQWLGKKIFDEQGHVAAKLKKGSVNPEIAVEKMHYVDGLSGATLTSNGVNNLLHFWLGENGFGTFLAKVQKDQNVQAQ
jgi:Na+-transporting NADH:ubiquinone oxidoreductase subunit C